MGNHITTITSVVVETPKIELQKNVTADNRNTINIENNDNVKVEMVEKVENILPIKPKITNLNLNLNKKTVKRIILPVGSKTRLNIFTHKNGVNRYVSNKNKYRK